MRIILVHNVLIALLLSFFSLPRAKPAVAATASASKYLQQGLLYRASQRYPEAIAALKKSVELEPQKISSRVILGWTLHLAGQEDAATQTLLQAAYLNPFNVPTFNALGIVLLVSGDLTDAAFVHSWAIILNPNNEIAYYNLSLAYHRLHQYSSAIATASRAATLEPTNPHPLVAFAIAYWDSGEHSLAQKAYRRALNLDPRYRDRTFLAHLKQAGFSPAQIQTTEQVLLSLT